MREQYASAFAHVAIANPLFATDAIKALGNLVISGIAIAIAGARC
jgi:hypothetical protein